MEDIPLKTMLSTIAAVDGSRKMDPTSPVTKTAPTCNYGGESGDHVIFPNEMNNVLAGLLTQNNALVEECRDSIDEGTNENEKDCLTSNENKREGESRSSEECLSYETITSNGTTGIEPLFQSDHATRRAEDSDYQMTSPISERRKNIMEERRSCSLVHGMWKAHENGLGITRRASRCSMFHKRSILLLEESDGRPGYGKSGTFNNHEIRRRSSRRLSLNDLKAGAGTQVVQSGENVPTSAKLFRQNKVSSAKASRCWSRRASLDSAAFFAMPPSIPESRVSNFAFGRRNSVRFSNSTAGDDDDSLVSASTFGTKTSTLDRSQLLLLQTDSFFSFPSIPVAYPLSSPGRRGSIGSYRSGIRLAHPIRSDSFMSSIIDDSKSIQTYSRRSSLNSFQSSIRKAVPLGMESAKSYNSSAFHNDFGIGDVENENATCYQQGTVSAEKEKPSIDYALRDHQQQLFSNVEDESQSLDCVIRPSFTRFASSLSCDGEGVEVADRGEDSAVFFGKRSLMDDSMSQFSGIGTCSSYDEIFSHNRLSNIFRFPRRRSMSDDLDVALGSYIDVDKQSFDDQPTFFRDDLQSPEFDFFDYDPWSAAETESELDNGANNFKILGTSANDDSAQPHVMSPPLLESLSAFLPFEKRGENFLLKYSMVRDGASIETLLQKCYGAKYSFLAVETMDGEVFGSFTTNPWRKSRQSFGLSYSFLWKMTRSRKEKCRSIIEKAELESKIEIYPYCKMHENVQTCTSSIIALGGGTITSIKSSYEIDIQKQLGVNDHEFGYGLQLSDDLLFGTSSPCLAFASPSLSVLHSDGSRFEVMNIELWTLTPCNSLQEAEKLEISQLNFEGMIASKRR